MLLSLLFFILNYYGSTALGVSPSHRTKRWIRDDILTKAPNKVKDVICGTYPVNVNSTYRIRTPPLSFETPSDSFDCSWKFYGTGCNPVISCDPFVLPQSTRCKTYFLEITDGFSVSKKFCGTSGPTNTATGSSILTANFPASLTFPKPGFVCLVTCTRSSSGLNVITDPLPPPTIANCTCGVPGAGSYYKSKDHRIVGGHNAPPQYWKWQVALVPKSRQTPFCGAALINDRFVLSAAHCVVNTGLISAPGAAELILNAYNLKNASELTIRKGIAGIYPHPLYTAEELDYDYAVIEFSEPVNLVAATAPTVRTVCLPPRGSRKTFEGAIGTATGWGLTSEGGNQSLILKEADIPIISNADCSRQYENSQDDYTITNRMLCAAYPEGGVDSCQGDSGGPFVLKKKNGNFMEIGVISFGEGCAEKGKPGVYARVTDVNDWIRMVAKRGTWCSE